MTWLFTAQVAALALTLGAGSYFYARALARSFDRRFGQYEAPALQRSEVPGTDKH